MSEPGTPLIWSATPTPLTADRKIDQPSVRRMVKHHLRLGVSGLFLLGTCGEGAWLPDRQQRELVEAVVKANRGRLRLAVQVTDNSAPRIIDNMRWVADAGADVAVIAPPFFFPAAGDQAIYDLYAEAVAASPLPVGIYDRGNHPPTAVPDRLMRRIYALPQVTLVKDSSGNPDRARIALAARKRRPGLTLLDGDEFRADEYMALGYDGLLLGGAIFNGAMAADLIRAAQQGDQAGAARLQARMNRLMWEVYGGKRVACWLAGLKHLLVQMGVFSTTVNYLGYTVSPACERAIARAMERERDYLLPPTRRARS